MRMSCNEFRKSLIPDTDFDLHNEIDIVREINAIDDFLHDEYENLGLYDIADLESKLKYRVQLLKEVRKNRCDFTFKEDVEKTTSTSPIDIQLRDKVKDNNYKGFFKKEDANKMVKRINKRVE